MKLVKNTFYFMVTSVPRMKTKLNIKTTRRLITSSYCNICHTHLKHKIHIFRKFHILLEKIVSQYTVILHNIGPCCNICHTLTKQFQVIPIWNIWNSIVLKVYGRYYNRGRYAKWWYDGYVGLKGKVA